MKHSDPNAEIVEVPRAAGDRAAIRRAVQLSARRCVTSIVDYLGACAGSCEPPRQIGEIAQQMVARAEALAAARRFIADCEASDRG